jgi:NCS1 family nucleobase:cation symporter-1
LNDFLTVADQYIWVDTGADIGFWHVVAFAWICNLAMHGGMGDMTLFRFAKNAKYGYYSALGMFIGHYIAWICAGIMGAAAALLLNVSITELDAGVVAFQALGSAGILAVIIAGWTTSNPTIYRAGLAFQSLNHKWDRTKVTMVVGIITTIIACFPFVFSQLLSFLGIMGLMIVPVGAIIVTEHWVFPKIGLTRYWSKYKGNKTNVAAMVTWLLSLGLSYYLVVADVLHMFFILLPIWLFTTVVYCSIASIMGAKEIYPEAAVAEQFELARKASELAYLNSTSNVIKDSKNNLPALARIAKYIAWAALACCAFMGVMSYVNHNMETIRTWLIAPTLVYFLTATYAYLAQNTANKIPVKSTINNAV